MYGMEFKARALRVIAQNGGSCSRAARELGVVNVRTLYRWRGEQEGFVRRRYVRLTPAQKRCVARRVRDGADVRGVAAEYGVCVATVYNIRNESRAKGALAFMGMGHDVEVPDGDPAALPDDVEALRKRCEDLELDNAILAQTVEILKKTQASTRR